MDSSEDVIKQVCHACRNYPGLFAATEVITRAFMLLAGTVGTSEKVRLLVDGLPSKERLKLLDAANEVIVHSRGVDAFRPGMVYYPHEEGISSINFEDQEVPMQFVHELKQALEKSGFGSAAAS